MRNLGWTRERIYGILRSTDISGIHKLKIRMQKCTVPERRARIVIVDERATLRVASVSLSRSEIIGCLTHHPVIHRESHDFSQNARPQGQAFVIMSEDFFFFRNNSLLRKNKNSIRMRIMQFEKINEFSIENLRSVKGASQVDESHFEPKR